MTQYNGTAIDYHFYCSKVIIYQSTVETIKTLKYFISITYIIIASSTLCSCLFNADGIFKQIGNSDYKSKIQFSNIIAVGDEGPRYIYGTILSEDGILPIKFTNKYKLQYTYIYLYNNVPVDYC